MNYSAEVKPTPQVSIIKAKGLLIAMTHLVSAFCNKKNQLLTTFLGDGFILIYLSSSALVNLS